MNTCEKWVQHSMRNVGKTYKSKCGKPAPFVDEHQNLRCVKHFKNWYWKKYHRKYDDDVKEFNSLK